MKEGGSIARILPDFELERPQNPEAAEVHSEQRGQTRRSHDKPLGDCRFPPTGNTTSRTPHSLRTRQELPNRYLIKKIMAQASHA
jgi:hypothetical protein